jgi:hypothetical protein
VDKFGLAVGGSIGWKVGPGILFADVRYGILHLIDPGYAKLIHGGIGYKIGFFDKEQP